MNWVREVMESSDPSWTQSETVDRVGSTTASESRILTDAPGCCSPGKRLPEGQTEGCRSAAGDHVFFGSAECYVCAIKDVWSNRIVGYSIDARMTASLATTALSNAVALRDLVRTIVHSDSEYVGAGLSRAS